MSPSPLRPARPREPTPAPTGPRRREDDFDVLAMAPSRYDHIDRLYRNVVLVLFAIGLAVGFWFKADAAWGGGHSAAPA